MIEPSLAKAEEKMKGSVEALKREFAGIRTGRASPALVEHVKDRLQRGSHPAQPYGQRFGFRHQPAHHPTLGPGHPDCH